MLVEEEMSELSRLSTESAVAGSHHVSPQPDYTHLPPEQYARLPLQSDYAGSGGNGGNGDVPLPPPSATTTAPYDDLDDADSYPEKSVLKQMEDYEKDQQRRVTQSDVINPPSRAELQDALREANYLRLVVERQRALLDGAEAAAKDTAAVHKQEKQELRQEIEQMGRQTVEKFKKMTENHAVLMAQTEVEAGRLREKNEWLMRMLDMDAAAEGYASGKPHVSPDAPGRQPDLHMPSMHAGEEEYVPERQHVPPDASRRQSSSHSRQQSSSNISSSMPQQPMDSNNTNSDFPAMSTEQMKELSRASMMTQRPPALSTGQLQELSREYSTMTQRPRPPDEGEIWEQWPPEAQPERSTMRSKSAGKQRRKSQPPRDELKQPETQPKRRSIKNPPPTTSKKKKKEEWAEPLEEEEWAEPLEKEEWKVPIVAASSSESDSEDSGFDSDSSSEESAPKERVPVRSSKKNEKEKKKIGRRKPPTSDSDSDSDSDSSLGSDESSSSRKGRKEKPNPSGGKGVRNRAFSRKLGKSGSSVMSAPTKKKSTSSSVDSAPLSAKRTPFSRLMPGRSKSVTKSSPTVPSSKSKKASGGSGSVAGKGSSRKARASSRSDSSSSSARRKPSVKPTGFSRLMNRGKSVTKVRPPPSPSSKSRKGRANDSPPRMNRSSRKARENSRSPGRDRGNQKQRNTDKKRNKNKG